MSNLQQLDEALDYLNGVNSTLFFDTLQNSISNFINESNTFDLLFEDAKIIQFPSDKVNKSSDKKVSILNRIIEAIKKFLVFVKDKVLGFIKKVIANIKSAAMVARINRSCKVIEDEIDEDFDIDWDSEDLEESGYVSEGLATIGVGLVAKQIYKIAKKYDKKDLLFDIDKYIKVDYSCLPDLFKILDKYYIVPIGKSIAARDMGTLNEFYIENYDNLLKDFDNSMGKIEICGTKLSFESLGIAEIERRIDEGQELDAKKVAKIAFKHLYDMLKKDCKNADKVMNNLYKMSCEIIDYTDKLYKAVEKLPKDQLSIVAENAFKAINKGIECLKGMSNVVVQGSKLEAKHYATASKFLTECGIALETNKKAS